MEGKQHTFIITHKKRKLRLKEKRLDAVVEVRAEERELSTTKPNHETICSQVS